MAAGAASDVLSGRCALEDKRPEKDGRDRALTYREAGVDVDAGMEVVERIRSVVAGTRRPEVLSDVGGFAGLFQVPAGYEQPVLVSGADGVGTKLKVAFAAGRHDTVGIDLVAMCANDVAVTGAEVLFFLDYLATGHVEPAQMAEIVSGVAAGCRLAGCALLGGETAEMPGFYPDGEYDLSGFAVGVVEKGRILDGRTVQAGDVVLGLASSGLHSNGYSLVRKALFDQLGLGIGDRPDGLDRTLGEELLEPTRIYVSAIKAAMAIGGLKAAAHITGGGLIDNPPRVLPDGLGISFVEGSWQVPPIFDLIATAGVERSEMLRTFNMGLGMVLVVGIQDVASVRTALEHAGETVWQVGRVVPVEAGVPAVSFEKQ
ncbi:MAG: phosphoribosylformylglycinamidine cyclo-ligase [Deltaproteobacteria bacterium]|nr:phosphoribosylformylglycinamidine cyclo-ligase [Deltaproteobacteria bacterium]